MAVSMVRNSDAPISALNTAPLIDVMLVLLVMFIITIPLQTSAVKIDVPPTTPGPGTPPSHNELSVSREGVIRWNGAAIDGATLRDYLARTLAQSPQPALQFRPDADARYEAVDRVLAEVKRAGVTRIGFVGNERYARFAK